MVSSSNSIKSSMVDCRHVAVVLAKLSTSELPVRFGAGTMKRFGAAFRTRGAASESAVVAGVVGLAVEGAGEEAPGMTGGVTGPPTAAINACIWVWRAKRVAWVSMALLTVRRPGRTRVTGEQRAALEPNSYG